MDLGDVQSWVDRYVAAWRTYDREAIGQLFADDARYYTAPFRSPKQGRGAIQDFWLQDQDEPDSWNCSYQARAVTGDTAAVTGWTTYRSGERYHNAYIVRFDDDGRATEFTEYWMLEPSAEAQG